MAGFAGLPETKASALPYRPRIAALLTCHNRRELTLRCLTSLADAAKMSAGHVELETYLVDDGCTDGTGGAVRRQFPDVHVIVGTGDLYWCGGMRLAWKRAAENEYDGYLWLNDDVTLDSNALDKLLDVAHRYGGVNEALIVVGATRNEGPVAAGAATYGGLSAQGVLPSSNDVRRIELFNGNIVLVSRRAFQVLGSLSSAYTHGLGDIDYGVRAKRAGVPVWLDACLHRQRS